MLKKKHFKNIYLNINLNLGSGLYFQDNDRWVIGGLVSKRVLKPFDVSCTKTLLQTVIFTSITEHYNWIEQNQHDQMSYTGEME